MNLHNYKKQKNQKNITKKSGVTVLELLIVLAIIGILVAVVLPQFSRVRENQALKNATSDMLTAVDKARGQTLASLNSSEYGVHFEVNQIIIFKGTAFSAGATDNEVIYITTPVSITNVTFGGVSSTTGNIYFSLLSGAPSTTGTVTVANTTTSKTLTISATGIASLN